ncbi:hypothetical protein NDU88_002248 [Pleurodeles waltl]|uniref:Uncharacterized protein n=1 Tax=Pleurodeles waltl TaxID=8319 RepID=A0AAV7SCP2_PLEWA|nr:hypothetical protein NDU88_002248 [Pleurodeles waltl]
MTSCGRPYRAAAVGERVFLVLADQIRGPQWPQQELGYFSFVWAIFLPWAAVGLLFHCCFLPHSKGEQDDASGPTSLTGGRTGLSLAHLTRVTLGGDSCGVPGLLGERPPGQYCVGSVSGPALLDR